MTHPMDGSSAHSPRRTLVQGVRELASRLFTHGVPWAKSVYAVVGLYLLVGFGLSLLAVWGFIELADEVLAGTTRELDTAVLRWLDAHSSPALTSVALEVTLLGDAVVVGAIGLVASVFLWIGGHRRSVALLWIALAGTLVLNDVLKAGFGRPRPQVFEWRVGHEITSLSFPSGHSMSAMVAWVTFAYLIVRAGASGPLRRLVVAVAVLAVLLVGWSRMYLGVHYPTDVLGGWAVGWAWAMICVFAVDVMRELRVSGRDPTPGRETA